MRLIDADVLGIGRAKRDAFIVPEYADGWNSALEILENAPTVDAELVVRCKNCRYFRHNNENETYCVCAYGMTDPEATDFCSYGEKAYE